MDASKIRVNTEGGIGVPSLLLVLFIGLKLTGHINWSWWWVMSPLWIPLCLVCLILLAVIIIGNLMRAWRERKQAKARETKPRETKPQ